MPRGFGAYDSLEVQVDGGLATVVLTRPDVGNCFDETFCHEFGRLGNDLAGRHDVRAVLLTARGSFFSVGGDLDEFLGDLDRAPEVVRDHTAGLHMGMSRLMRINAPLVACVEGPALGGAVSIVSNCDVVYAGRSARFGAAYTRIGLTCDLGGSFGLASRMGPARARRFLLLGETVDADDAERIGLVDFVVDDDLVAGEARKCATALSKGPTRAYGEVRRLMVQALRNPVETQLEDEAQAIARAAGTVDAHEGIRAFKDKRAPRFEGR